MTCLSSLVGVGVFGIGVAYIVPHTGDLFIKSCRCVYVLALMLDIPPHQRLEVLYVWVYSSINVYSPPHWQVVYRVL